MRLLTWDLKWKHVSDIKVGDQLIGFDEDIKFSVPELQKSIVKSVKVVKEPSYRFYMDSDITLDSSHKHLWVGSSPARHHISWRATEKLKVNYNLRLLVEPWDELRTYDAGWLAGYLDGEGSLSGYILNHAQKNGSVYNKAHSLLQELVSDTIHTDTRESVKYDAILVDRIANLPDIMTILGAVRPLRLLEKWPEFITYRQAKGKLSSIQEIEPLGITDVWSIETTTGTFIADGYLSHNCHNRWHAANDPSYDWNNPVLTPHKPEPQSKEEQSQALFAEMRFLASKQTLVRD